ncbi:MAG: hypothetical protein WAL98_06370, partial [Desulfatiglandaceae bacterium]
MFDIPVRAWANHFVSLMISMSYKMIRIPDRLNKGNAPSLGQISLPIHNAMINMPPLKAWGNRPLQMTFEDQLKMLIFFHLEEFSSA